MFENALNSTLRKTITSGSLRVTYPSGRQETYGDGSGPPLAVRFKDEAALRSVALDPGLAGPERYMDGGLVIEEGSAYDLIAVMKSNMRPEVATPVAKAHHLRRSVTSASQTRAR